MVTADKLLADLAAALPSEFTRERNALLARLIKAGQSTEAARVKAVPRPTVPVWAVNRLAREEPKAVEKLIAATERMGAAQLGRGARGGDFQSASADHRSALAHLTARAEAAITEAGLGASHQVLLRIGTTLTAAAADPAQRTALRQGRVERELAARGFEVFAGRRLTPNRVVAPAEHRQRVRASPRKETESPERSRTDETDDRRHERLAETKNALARAEADLSTRRSQLETVRQRVQEARRLLREAQAAEAHAREDEKRAAKALHVARAAMRAAETMRTRPVAKRRG